jgi:hypothetical protein
MRITLPFPAPTGEPFGNRPAFLGPIVRSPVLRPRVVPGRLRVQALCPRPGAAAPRYFRAVAGSRSCVRGLLRRPRIFSSRLLVQDLCPQPDAADPRSFQAIAGSGPVPAA